MLSGRHFQIGLPLPGTELKFIPNGEKLELRVRGVNIFPGYRNAPQTSADAFDEEGYYKIGAYEGLIKSYKNPFSPTNHDALSENDYVWTQFIDNEILPVGMKK